MTISCGVVDIKYLEMNGPNVHPQVREESVALAALHADVVLLFEVNGPDMIFEVAAAFEPAGAIFALERFFSKMDTCTGRF
jgi:hypothetical protein